MYDPSPHGVLFTSLVPSYADINSSSTHDLFVKLKWIVTINIDISKVSETSKKQYTGRLVQTCHLNSIASFLKNSSGYWLKTTTVNKIGMTLGNLECGYGVASASSMPDAYMMAGAALVAGVGEAKNGSSSVSEAIRQAVAIATNIAIMRLNRGESWDDIIVPVFGCNGHLIQFGAVLLLYPSFPYFVCTSKVLDMCDDNECLLVSATFNKIGIYLYQLSLHASTKTSIQNPFKDLRISTRQYFFKPMSQMFSMCHYRQDSLYRFFKLLSLLHKSLECRQRILFPYCVRSTEPGLKSFELVFLNLSSHRIGVPTDMNIRQLYLRKIKQSMIVFHSFGIIHLDFYPSNFMWCALPGNKLDLKIIDWDSIHSVYETIHTNASNRLSASRKIVKEMSKQRHESSSKSRLPDMCYWDISLYEVLEENIDDQLLQTDDKGQLDRRFRELVEIKASNYNHDDDKSIDLKELDGVLMNEEGLVTDDDEQQQQSVDEAEH
jgi:hypothetical protein